MRVSLERIAEQPVTYLARFHQDGGDYTARSPYIASCVVSVRESFNKDGRARRVAELRGLTSGSFDVTYWTAMNDALHAHGVHAACYERADGRRIEVRVAAPG